MHPNGIVCAFVGHRWVQPPEFHETYPVFECQRCGRQQEFAQGTQHAGFGARLDAETALSKAFYGDGEH